LKYVPKFPFLTYPADSPVNQSLETTIDGTNYLRQQYSRIALLKTAN